MESNPIDTVVLASGVNRIPLYPGYTPGYKALVPFAGRASICYVLNALHSSGCCGRVCLVGPRADLEPIAATRPNARDYEFVEGGETLLQSVVAGLRHYSSSPAVLATSADLPLLTPSAVQDFLRAAMARRSGYAEDLHVSVVPQGCYTGVYRRFTKPFNRFRDISLCHGNLFLANPRLLDNPAATRRIDKLYQGRKSALTAALALGPAIAFTYMVGVELLHSVRLDWMARFASRRFGFGIVPVVVEHPEITIDVDEPDDYEFVRRVLEGDRCLADPLSA